MKDGVPFWLFIGLLLVAYFFLHLTLGLETGAPDLLTVAVLLAARQLPGGGAAAVGFALGLLDDAASVTAFGAAAATFTIIAYIGARSRDLFVGDSLLFLTLYLFVGVWAQEILYYLLAPALRHGDAVDALLMQAPLQALYAAAVGLVAILVYRTLTR